jgi:hypothetical protein
MSNSLAPSAVNVVSRHVNLHAVPRWLKKRLNEKLNLQGPSKLRSKLDAAIFIVNRSLPGYTEPRCDLFDHWGTDANDNLVTEPYARSCVTCLSQAVVFAKTLGLGLRISDDVEWYPESKECIRFTFSLEPYDLSPADVAAPWIADAKRKLAKEGLLIPSSA